MRVSRLFFGLAIFVLLTAVGCSNSSDKGKVKVHKTENPNAEEVLNLDPEADIFQFDGVIYQTGIDWVEELTLTKDKQVGEIKTKNDTDTNFEDEMSNKLPVVAKIFSVKEKEEIGGPILLVESEGKLFKYYGLVEG
ncbi:hypothetical protein AB3Z07_27830 (plasmid) [Metabacillus halosaccharovorans]|uniref:hypothetical protein n=1 Tax=Metabacillus halosaccharovorans TaxID=930124 RepID=UPI00203F7100|nr:hypothetical protein [Metabacillus halosaccharovorans]MCM3441372.1 hypothetical protein [Metabacillus halosaccharovorans]